MKQLFITFVLLLALSIPAYAQLTQQDYGWDIYGDRYPLFQRPYNDVSNFFILEGPGNDNPGNFKDIGQSNESIRIPAELKTYIARQFKYVLFDQESFCDRDGYKGPVVSMMTPVYHAEAESLMNRSTSIVVLPYFTFTLMRPQYPWRSSVPEAWFLHQAGQPADSAHRIRAAENGFFLMDIGNAQWRSFYKNYIVRIRDAHNYRGVFLDNMTRYPWINQYDYQFLASGVFDGWLGNLITFLNDLTTALGSSVVICNSLGLDDNDPQTPLLFGPNHGKDLMPYASGGALFESFHGTAWKSTLDTTILIMKWMRDHNKIFLGATHYYRGQDDGQRSENILPNRFGLEPSTGWLSNSAEWPPLQTFYRMQMSYLARWLLVTPNAGQPAFGYSFQPGVQLYQCTPYYKPWDEKIGTADDIELVDRGTYYERKFANAIAYVNKSELSPVTIQVPTGNWYWYPYYGSVLGNNISDMVLTSGSVTLNRMEGIVLFKKVTVDQKLEDGSTSVDSIGHWETSNFVNYGVPKGFSFNVGTNEVLRGAQQVLSSQKYNRWNEDADVVNHRSFLIELTTNQLISKLKSTQAGVVIKTDLVDLPGTTGGNIQFRDPWYIDYPDPQYGNNWRNRGMQEARYLTRSLTGPFAQGWQPDFTTTYPESPNHPYRGVFLNQRDDVPNPVYYSVGAPSQQIGNLTWNFVDWKVTQRCRSIPERQRCADGCGVPEHQHTHSRADEGSPRIFEFNGNVTQQPAKDYKPV